MRVFIAGAGTMGAGIAEAFLTYGHEVWLYDTVEAAVQSGERRIRSSLQRKAAKGRYTEEQVLAWLDHLWPTTDLSAAGDVELVVEAVFESMLVKQEFLQELDSICRESTIIASNTSALSITEMSYGLQLAQNVCGMHFFNPAPENALVEIVPGLLTATETVERVRKYAIAIGKEPVIVKECAGFIVNRLLVPQINDAIFLLNEGVCDAHSIDKAMCMAAKHPIGPLHLADWIGLDAVWQILQLLQEETGDDRYRPCPLLKKMVRAGLLGRKTGQGFFRYDEKGHELKESEPTFR